MHISSSKKSFLEGSISTKFSFIRACPHNRIIWLVIHPLWYGVFEMSILQQDGSYEWFRPHSVVQAIWFFLMYELKKGEHKYIMYFDYSFPHLFTINICKKKIGTDKLTPVQTNTANNYIIYRIGKVYLLNDHYQPDPHIFSFV